MSSKQVTFEELDIAAQLRLIMAMERLTVSERPPLRVCPRAQWRSIWPGPDSPRATSIASLCANLGLSMEWLLFGYSDNDRLRVRDHVLSAMVDLMHDLKEIGQLKEAFDGIEVGSKGFTTFALKLASDLAENVAEKVWESRKRTMREAAKGYKTAILEPVLFRAPSEQE